jgi:hypothetical protein
MPVWHIKPFETGDFVCQFKKWEKQKNSRLSEPFQNQISIAQKEAKYISLAHKYKKWRGYTSFLGSNPPFNEIMRLCKYLPHAVQISTNKTDNFVSVCTYIICPIPCLHVFSSVFWCPLQFPLKTIFDWFLLPFVLYGV